MLPNVVCRVVQPVARAPDGGTTTVYIRAVVRLQQDSRQTGGMMEKTEGTFLRTLILQADLSGISVIILKAGLNIPK